VTQLHRNYYISQTRPEIKRASNPYVGTMFYSNNGNYYHNMGLLFNQPIWKSEQNYTLERKNLNGAMAFIPRIGKGKSESYWA
jgi:hypothetical protein